MKPKKNDYVILSRISPTPEFESLDLEEFSDAVRGYRNAGYKLHGEMNIICNNGTWVISQVVIGDDALVTAEPIPVIDEVKSLEQRVLELAEKENCFDELLISVRTYNCLERAIEEGAIKGRLSDPSAVPQSKYFISIKTIMMDTSDSDLFSEVCQ